MIFLSLSFRYRKEKFKNKTSYFPKIPVLLYNEGISIETPALLDSGATDLFIPKEIAEEFELNLRNPDTAESWTGKFKVWESRIGIVVGKGSQTFRKVLPCIVPDKKGEHDQVVLGRSFFRFFEITFNEDKKITKLKRLV